MNTSPQLLEELVKLTSIRDAELLEYSLLRTIQDVLSPPVLSLFRLNASGDLSFLMVSDDERGPRVPDSDLELDAHAQAIAAPLRSDDPPQRAQQEDGSQLSIYPIVEMRGLRTYLHVQTRAPLRTEEERLIDGFLRFYRNYCSLLDYSQRDQLTGLMNRKTFDESVYKLFSRGGHARTSTSAANVQDDRRALRNVGQFWLGMIDIDHFKRINDGFGHLYGDEVLLLAAQIMQRSFRDGDLLFRFGGEEFVVITQNIDAACARRVFERLRHSMESFRFPQVGTVTISIGLVQMQPGSLTPVLLDQADKALYYAKQNGRNQIAVFEELQQQGLLSTSTTVSGSVDLF